MANKQLPRKIDAHDSFCTRSRTVSLKTPFSGTNVVLAFVNS